MRQLNFFPKISNFRRSLPILFFFCSFSAWCALPSFTLTVTPTDETCTNNGSLAFSVSGTDLNATVTYTIFHLPDVTTAIATLSGNTYGGLSAGNYRVVATQTLGAESNSMQADAVIASNIVVLSFSVSGQNAICGSDGKITVSILQGTAVSYEIFSGPVIRPLQPSPIFDLLPAGAYQIRAFDACGEGVVQDFVLQASPPGFTISLPGVSGLILPSCDSINMVNSLSASAGHIIAYPLVAEYIVHPPSGAQIQFSQTLLSGDDSAIGLSQIIPFYYDQLYTYDLKITDGCGNVYTRNGNIVNTHLSVSLQQIPVSCNSKKLIVAPAYFVAPFTISFLSAPSGFDPTIFNPIHPGPFSSQATYYNPSFLLPEGTYVVKVDDFCGHSDTQSITIHHEGSPAQVIASSQMGCEEGFGGIGLMSFGSQIQSVIMTSAPAAYQATLPQDVTFNLSPNGIFIMNGLPGGLYSFETVDACNTTQNTTVMLFGYAVSSDNHEIFPGCNSFDLELHHVDNLLGNATYWLQKLDPATGQWGHPVTGYSQGEIGGLNAVPLTNNAINYSLAYTGTFRVVQAFSMPGDANQGSISCYKEIYNFSYAPEVKINSIDAFSCSPASSDVIVTATGVAPLIYRITSKNGQPFAVDNGNNSLFTTLEPAIYNFQVEDACGNIVNRVYDISLPLTLVITPSGLCDGQPGSLSVPALSFLTYEWWKDGDQSNILSTSNSLSFAAFNSVADAGTYHLHISYPNLNSCIDRVLDFVISPALNNPQAGTGLPASYCGSQGNIDLFTLLAGNHDDFGTWTEVSSSGALLDNIFDTDAAGLGNFIFKYRVNGLCSFFDEATVNITISEIPETPLAFLEQDVCSGQPLHLLATTVANAGYQWTGPNGFVSFDQNPVIANPTAANNGTYTVKAVSDACFSDTSSVEVAVLPMPDLTINSGCSGNAFMLSATATDGSDVQNMTFSWTGPENFSATGNPVDITGNPGGVYIVTAGGETTCSSTATVTVSGTVCGIPKGVSPNSDGENDTWDLSGLDIEHVKIFNRYGMVVYEKAGYVDDWRGQDKNGNILPTATYYYLVKLASGESKTGWVYLLQKS